MLFFNLFYLANFKAKLEKTIKYEIKKKWYYISYIFQVLRKL